MRYPAWIPYPSSWLNAFVLALLSSGIATLIESLSRFTLRISLSAESIELFVLGTIAALLSPIPLIALLHHLIHAGLSRFAPQLQPPEIGKVRGYFPGLISWWESLWAWLVFVLSTLIAFVAIIISASLLGVEWSDPFLAITPAYENLIMVTAIAWMISAAYLYQIDHLAEKRMLRQWKIKDS